MALHLLSAERLSKLLSAGEVSAREQASYLSAGLIVWILPIYLMIAPRPNFSAWPIAYGLWFYEAGALVVIYVLGVHYCLARCRVEPKKNFLIDFSCLYAPISLTTHVIVWSIFSIYASLIPSLLLKQLTFSSPPRLIEFFYSARFIDLMGFLAVISVNFFVLIRIGNYMERISNLRLSANPTVEPDVRESDARGSP